MTWTSERLARAALTVAAEPGVMAKRLVEMTTEELWWKLLTDSGERWHERAKSLDVDQLVERSEKAAMRFLIPGDEEWPTSLPWNEEPHRSLFRPLHELIDVERFSSFMPSFARIGE